MANESKPALVFPLFDAIDGDRRTGRSTRLMAYANALALDNPEARMVIAAPTSNGLANLKRLLHAIPATVSIHFVTAHECRGLTFDYAFVDDADFVKPAILASIEAATTRHMFVVRGRE